MICQMCGIEAPTRYVTYYQNIGMLLAHQTKWVSGYLCKRCVHRYFWEFTGITFLIGWCSYVSLLLGPLCLLNNIARYSIRLFMPGVPPDATVPRLTNDVFERVKPHIETLFTRL